MSIGIGIGIGLVAGVLAGMLGIGGGVVKVPGLALLLDTTQHIAQGVSIAVVVVTATVGAVLHYRQGNVRLSTALWVAPSAAIFSFLGASLAGITDATWLCRAFGVLLLAVGSMMVLGKLSRNVTAN